MRKITVIGTTEMGMLLGAYFSHMGHDVIWYVEQQEDIKLSEEEELVQFFNQEQMKERLKKETSLAKSIEHAELIFYAESVFSLDTLRLIRQYVDNYKVLVIHAPIPLESIGRLSEELHHPLISMDIISNPLFLRQGFFMRDFLHPDRLIIGTDSLPAARILEELYEPLQTRTLITDLASAELIRYATHAYLATKISFINEIGNIAEKLEANIRDISLGMGLDNRIGSRYLQAGIGFGGEALIQQTKDLANYARTEQINPLLLEASLLQNTSQIEVFYIKLSQALNHQLHGKKIAILGLSFKPETSSIVESPALQLIPRLLEQGAKISAYDPAINVNIKEALGRNIEYTTTPYLALEQADVALILTEWEEIKWINLNKVAKIMKQKIVIDGRNCFTLESMRDLEFYYDSMGRTRLQPSLLFPEFQKYS